MRGPNIPWPQKRIFDTEATPETGDKYWFDFDAFYAPPDLKAVQTYFGPLPRDCPLNYDRIRQHPEQFLHG